MGNSSEHRAALWAKILLGSIALVILYRRTFAEMAHLWWNDTYAVHGMFVPLFSAHILWMDRRRLGAAVAAGDRRGLILLLAAVALLALGDFLGSLVLRGWSLILALSGLLLWLLGRDWTRIAAFPLAFLLLMVPFPHAAVEKVTTHLQLFAASFAGGVLELLGVPSYQEGVLIHMPQITLQIAEICNGLRFLLALLVLTIAFAELMLPTLGRKAVLVASVFPVAILANATRVAVVCLAVYYWSPEAASGPIHHGIGKAVWILTLVPMGLIYMGLRRP